MLARFVTRNDGTILVGGLTKGQTALKPDTVYEIREIMGVLQIVEVGMSIIPENNQDVREGKIFEYGTWGSQIGELLSSAGSALLLSAKERSSAGETGGSSCSGQ